MQEIHRILFIRTDRMGDVLMNLPAVRLLRQTFPKAWLVCLVDEPIIDLLKDHPDVDEWLPLRAEAFQRSFFARWNLFWKIKKIGFDLVIISNPNKIFHALFFLARIPVRVGYDRKWGFLLTKKMKPSEEMVECHEIDRNLGLIGLISEKFWDGRLVLPEDAQAREVVEGLLKRDCPGSERLFAVHAGTSDPQKRWSVDRFAELCDRLQGDLHSPVILIGGPEEKDCSRELVSQTRIPPIDWTGQLSLRELTAFFQHPRVRVLVSSDSGPVHIAWISGKPVVAMYAKNKKGVSPLRWGPRDGASQTIYKPMDEISVEEVFSLVRKIV